MTLIESLHSALGRPEVEFLPGVSYRNLMIYRGRPGEARFDDQTITDPPHDHPGQTADEHLPRGPGSELLRALMTAVTPLLAHHPVNRERFRSGKPPANAIWLWGQGKAPSVPRFAEFRGLKGAIISAVDLVRGVAVLAGWNRIDVPGATGYLRHRLRSQGCSRHQIFVRSRHCLRSRRSPRRGQPRRPGRRQGRGHREHRPRYRRPDFSGTPAIRPMAYPGLPRPFNPPSHPRPRSRPRRLDHGGHGVAPFRPCLR